MSADNESTRGRPLPRFRTVGFVGKRNLQGLPDEKVLDAVGAVLDELRRDEPAPRTEWVGLSSLAQGADTLFAEALSARRMLHQVFLPEPIDRFFDAKDFNDLDRSLMALDRDNVIEVRVSSRHENRSERFAETAGEIVDKCDVLLAVCTSDEWQKLKDNDLGSMARGGTVETLSYARKFASRVIVLALDSTAITRHDFSPPLNSRPSVPALESAVFDFDVVPAPLSELDFLSEVDAIQERAGNAGGRRKRVFEGLGRGVLLAHVLATLIAALVLVLGREAGFWYWAGWSWAKALLLLSGLGLASVLHRWRRETQGAWLEARMIAEICRSTSALAKPAAYPGSLIHLRDFHLPELRDFIKALNVLHLRTLRQTRGFPLGRSMPGETQAMYAFVTRYLNDRVLNQQATYYEPHGRVARKRQHQLELAFFVLSFLALSGAVLAAIFPPANEPGLGTLLVLKFAPLFLPVAAAATIGWMGLLDLDRRAERYQDMVSLLEQAKDPLRNAATPAILRSRVRRLESVLLQEVVEWHARMRHLRAG